MIGVIGGGGWGTALAKLCADKGYQVTIWAREAEVVDEINFKHTNSTFLAGVELPDSVTASTNLAEVVSAKKYLIVTVPSQWVRSVVREIKEYVSPDTVIISASKGIEVGSLQLITDII